MIIPSNNSWVSTQGSDLFGSIIRSRNIDLTERGWAKLARKVMGIFTEVSVAGTGDADFQDPFAIAADNTYYYVFTIDHTFGAAVSETAVTWGEVTSTSIPTTTVVSDAVAFNGEIAVSGSTTVHTLTGFNGADGSGTWTDKSISISASYPHPLCVFVNRNELAVANGNVVVTYNTSYSSVTTLTLPADYIVTCMRWRGSKLYIGTKTLSGTNAMVFVWEGSGTSAQQGWPVESNWVYSMTEYLDSVAILTAAGQLLRFSGAGFQVLDNFPVYYSPFSWVENATGQTIGKAVNRSMLAIGETIYITIQGESRGLNASLTYLQPGGLWVYQPVQGLSHRGGFVTHPYKILAISSLNSSEFAFASAHGAETGDPVWAHSVSNIAALTPGFIYYVIKTSTTALKLARSPADAFAGRYITCSGSISGDKLVFDTLNSFGSTTSCLPGPIHGFTRNQMSPFFATEILFAGNSRNASNTTVASLMSLGEGRNRGNIVTPKIYGAGITDIFQKIVSNIRDLNLDTDSAVIKYRTRERFGVPTPLATTQNGLGIWVDSTSFTVDTTLKDFQSVEVGDEVEFMSAAGSGYTAHITAIDNSTSTWTITVDETVPLVAASDYVEVVVDNWTKLGVITNASANIADGYHEQTIGVSGSWIQFKIELRGRDVSINMLNLLNSIHKQA